MATSRLVCAGALTAVTDFLFSSILVTVFYHSTFARLWQGVASVLFGPDVMNGGTKWIVVGLIMHVVTAFTWTAVFYFIVSRLKPVQALLASPLGSLKVAALYGPCIWLAMSFVVIPVLTHRGLPAITFRWFVQFFGHIPFVALPMVSQLAGRRDAPGA